MLAQHVEEDPLPPKAQRIVSIDRARNVLTAARLVSTLYRVPRNRILEKRKGGDEGRSLRRFLIYYARGLGSPVWECAEIFDLNRKQIGQEEASYLDMLSRNTDLEEDVENMTTMCDAAIRTNTGRFIHVSLSELQAEVARKRAVKIAKEAADMLERMTPVPLSARPRRVQTEVERLQAGLIAKRRAKAQEQAERICQAIIARGEAPNATKDERKEAARAMIGLAEIRGEAKTKKGKG